MSNPVDKKFNEKAQSYFEQIAYDPKEKCYYIKRSFPKSNDTEHHEISEWHFVTRIETYALVCREISDLELEHPVKQIFYKMPIIYEIKDSEDWVLKTTENDNPDDKLERKWLSVLMKNLNSGQCLAAPIPNSLYEKPYPWLRVTKGKAVRIEGSELEELCRSGTCIGVFDMNLQNRYTFS